MKTANRKLPLIVLGLSVLAAAQPASAGLIAQTVNYPTAPAPFSDSLSFNKFNTSLGTLTGVSIELSLTGSTMTQVVSTSSQMQTYTNASTNSSVSITSPDSTTISTSLNTAPASGTIAPSSTMTVGTDSGTVSSNVSLPPSHFPSFESAGAATFLMNAVGLNAYSGTTNSSKTTMGGPSSLGGFVTIDYTYTPTPAVPEPMSLVMVALGLGGIFAVSRFRHIRRQPC